MRPVGHLQRSLHPLGRKGTAYRSARNKKKKKKERKKKKKGEDCKHQSSSIHLFPFL